jgi:anti-sigma regulatory factor (Ser/Thr protein kinase)
VTHNEKASAVPHTELRLPYELKSARVARYIVEAFVAEQKLDRSTHHACVIASELVTNAVLYGAEPIALTVRCHDGDLTVEVADGDAGGIDNVRLRAVDQRTSGGRGLRIVAALADSWGTRKLKSGKAVWATTRMGRP